MIALQKTGVDAAGFANMSAAANQASRVFRDAAASTGMFEVQQLRLNSATDDYVKKLRQQKMSFREMSKQRKIAQAAYKEQLALENMQVRQNIGSTRHNKGVYDVIVPKEVSADVDTAAKRLAFLNAELKSGAHQMVNWGKNTQWAGRQLMVGFTMPIAAFGAAAGVMAYQVDKELTRIQKVIDTTATDSIGIEKELAQVRVDGLKTATQAAKEYGSAATDTLDVQAQLAATGKMGADLQASTLEVMRIARLGEVDNQTAIDATVALQSVFRETIKTSQDLTDAFNYMNSIENATSLSTADFATAIPIAASAVREFGGDVKELGVLLTAMRENGIPAAEGANALKATMQRLTRPSKQIREEWQAITGTDITELVNNADNLSGVFTAINEATKDLGDDDRRKAFAGLFGSYQVSRMMALTKGMDELSRGVGQVSKAYEISQGSTESWAATAEKEIERYQKSISGMFDTTYQSLKMELVEVGEPFVVLATQILGGVTAILKAFNDLPSGVKFFVAATVGATALAGGVLMLTGLIANLTGNVLKGVGAIASWALKMEIVDRETKAGQLASELASRAYAEQANKMELLTMQVEKYIAAQTQANEVMLMANPAFAGAQGATYDQKIASIKANQDVENQMTAFTRYDKNGKPYYVAPATGPEGTGPNASGKRGKISRADAELEARAVIQSRINRMTDAENDAIHDGNVMRAQATEDQKKRNQYMARAGVLAAVESAALATSLISTNEQVQDWANIVMLAGLVAPAIGMIGPAAKTLGARFKDAGIAAMDVAKGAKNSAKGATAAATSAGKLGKGFSVAKVALLGLMGPLGWTVTAVAAIGLTMFKFYKDAQEKQAEMVKAQERLANTAKDWGDNLGLARREQEKISMLALAGENDQKVTDFNRDVQYFNETDTGKQQVEDFKGLNEAQRTAAAMQMIVDVQNEFGVSANRAETMVAALYSEATGTSALNAVRLMGELSDKIGNLKTPDLSGMWNELKAAQQGMLTDDSGDSMWDSDAENMENRIKVAKEQAANIGQAFATSWFNSDTKSEWTAQFNSFADIAAQQWQNSFDTMIASDPAMKAKLQELGIESGKDLAIGMQKFGFKDKVMEALTPEQGVFFDQVTQGAEDYEKAIVKAGAAALGLGEDIESIYELQKNAVVAAAQMNFKDQKEAGKDAVRLVGAVSANYKETALDSATTTLNALLMANNLKTGKDYAEALARWTAFVKGDVYKAAGGANALASGLGRAKGQAAGLRGILANMDASAVAEAGKQVMSDFQNEIADNVRDKLADSQAAASDALAAQHEAASDALSARLDRESDALDAAWDGKRKGLEAYWDARIKGVEKAIEAEEKAEEKRQKMFDAEIARINKLADMANTNIDFNVALNEGNLDEAAKIANTAAAKEAESVFERERAKGEEKSAKRVDKLNERKDAMGERKDAALEAFDKRAEAAREYFDNYRQMEEDNLKKSQDAEKKALEQRQEAQKESLDRTLKTFLASTPTTKKALQKQVEELGVALDKFGIDVLDPMSQKWGNWFRNRMRDGLTNSALEAATADAWAKFGEQTKNAMLKAWGFETEKEFLDFINGKSQVGMKGAGKSPVDATPQEAADAAAANEKSGPPTARKTIRHKGGPIVGGNDSRYGVAKNYKGLHPSEIEVTARKGEYIMNEDAAKKFRPQLDAMNAGRGVGGKYGAAGRMGAVMVGSIAKGLMEKGKQQVENLRAAQAAAATAAFAGAGSGFLAGGYTPGQGGWNRPSVPGMGWSNTHDYRAPVGTPIYAISDGVIADSRAITSGGSPGNGSVTPGGVPYRSYGETIGMRAADGSLFRYAHLSARYVGAGQTVKGGALIGRTGNTGNSSGPHLHMDVNGNYNASGYLASRGIALRKGAEYVQFDNTLANLHRGESVLTKNLTSKMHEGVERFANGDGSEYNLEVNIYGAGKNADEIARKVEQIFERKAGRRPQSRKVGKKR